MGEVVPFQRFPFLAPWREEPEGLGDGDLRLAPTAIELRLSDSAPTAIKLGLSGSGELCNVGSPKEWQKSELGNSI